jgi:uncharacterized membrane protein YbhN (UPF0104 family)
MIVENATPRYSIVTHRGWRRILYLLLLLVVLASIIAELRALPWREALSLAGSATLSWLVVAVIAQLAIIPLWTVQWCLLVTAAVRLRVMAEVVSVTATIQHILPFFFGPVAATILLRTRAGCGNTAAVSVYAVDQLVNGIAKLAVIGLAVLLLPLPKIYQSGADVLFAGVAVSCVVLIFMARAGGKLRQLAARMTRTSNLPLLALADLAETFDTMRTARRSIAVVLLAIGKKALEVGAVVAVQYSCGITASLSSAVAVVAALGVSTMVPLTPANLGVYEATVFFIYRYCGVAPASALTAAVLQHFAVLLAILTPGSVLLFYRYFEKQQSRETRSMPIPATASSGVRRLS